MDGIGVINQQSLIVGEEEKHRISIYPNPANDFINVESEFKINTIQIYSTLGTLVKSYEKLSKNKTLDISSLPKGMYMLKVNSAKKNSLFKLIKQ